MVKSGRRPQSEASREANPTRQRLVVAAFETLRDEGSAHASARAVANRAGLTPALVFYHFGSVNALLVAALAHSSDTQLERYKEALAEVQTLPELVAAAEGQLRADFDSGHVRVMAELVSASAADEELRAQVLAQMQPWLAFTEETLERVMEPLGLIPVIPPEQMAFLIVAQFLGMELLATQVGDEDFIEDLFGSAKRVAGLFGGLMPPGRAPRGRSGDRGDRGDPGRGPHGDPPGPR